MALQNASSEKILEVVNVRIYFSEEGKFKAENIYTHEFAIYFLDV